MVLVVVHVCVFCGHEDHFPSLHFPEPVTSAVSAHLIEERVSWAQVSQTAFIVGVVSFCHVFTIPLFEFLPPF